MPKIEIGIGLETAKKKYFPGKIMFKINSLQL